MRYQNWDVLLFPTNSRVPIQEFNTACHVVADQGSPASSKWANSQDLVSPSTFESMSKTPVLTSFVGSLPSGTSYRVSIHSWAKPSPSAILKGHKGKDEPVAFQFRLFADGVLQSTRVYKEGTAWPEVIDSRGDLTSQVSMKPLTKPDDHFHELESQLAFPAFHPEILQQPRWDPAEPMGRIQVVLTEGILRLPRTTQPGVGKVSFTGLRDVVAFAFQHAPQDVLEYSAIAWPNAKLFDSRQSNLRRQTTSSTRSTGAAGPQAHSHSPQRLPSGGRDDVWTRMSSRADAGARDYSFRSNLVGEQGVGSSYIGATPVSNALSGMNDPFFAPMPDSSIGWRSSARKTSTDNTAPDYASTLSRDTDMSVTWPRRDFQKHMDEAAVDEIVNALSPSKKGELLNALSPDKSSSSGGKASINTPTTAEAERSQRGSPTGLILREGLLDAAAGNIKQSTGRSMMLRTRKTITPNTVQRALAARRGRSSSGSSKRKRSMSPSPDEDDQGVAPDLSPPTKAQQKRKAVVVGSDSESDKEIKSESRTSSTGQGVPLHI